MDIQSYGVEDNRATERRGSSHGERSDERFFGSDDGSDIISGRNPTGQFLFVRLVIARIFTHAVTLLNHEILPLLLRGVRV